jgi:radical SAM/Cys-rich protein
MQVVNPPLTPFQVKLQTPLTKRSIRVLQINLGKRCNLACTHCHVEAGPQRTEELTPAICDRLIEVIHRFPQLETVDLTGGAPEMNYGFRPLVEAARQAGKEVIVRSNLTIYEVPGYEDLPEYCASHQLRIVASLPCYLEDNVDRMRGNGVFDSSVRGLQRLNQLGYAHDPALVLDLVYNPQLPKTEQFVLPPQQQQLEQAYKAYLKAHFNVEFNHLFAIANLPVGRTQQYLERQHLHQPYLRFLAQNFNSDTVEQLMCREELSVDYRGYLYDCDFNQMADIPARTADGQILTVEQVLAADSLDLIPTIQTADYCYACTAGCGSSCGGSLL